MDASKTKKETSKCILQFADRMFFHEWNFQRVILLILITPLFSGCQELFLGIVNKGFEMAYIGYVLD